MDKLLSLKSKFEGLKLKHPVISKIWISIIDSRIDIIDFTCEQCEEILDHIKHEDTPLMDVINNEKLLLALYFLKMNNFLNKT